MSATFPLQLTDLVAKIVDGATPVKPDFIVASATLFKYREYAAWSGFTEKPIVAGGVSLDGRRASVGSLVSGRKKPAPALDPSGQFWQDCAPPDLDRTRQLLRSS